MGILGHFLYLQKGIRNEARKSELCSRNDVLTTVFCVCDLGLKLYHANFLPEPLKNFPPTFMTEHLLRSLYGLDAGALTVTSG